MNNKKNLLKKSEFYEDIHNNVIGIDEVGRGALCGPVVSCSILLKKSILNQNFIIEINDSKKIKEEKRFNIAKRIKKFSIFSFGMCSTTIIDKINILQATNKSMKKSFFFFKDFCNPVKIDGVESFFLNSNTEFIKKGDQSSVVIASASILAKCFRDSLMIKYSKMYPEYNFKSNKGYGTKDHLIAIKKFGITPIHRKSFAPVKKLIF